MPATKVNISEFLELAVTMPVLDVRSPGEFAHAHIPGAVSFPLFSDGERKEIGTAYKQQSREAAIRIGLASFGKNLVSMIDAAEKIVSDKKKGSRDVCVHCWRGGMRSAAVAWLLDLYGFKVYVLNGGYKSYRRWALLQFERNYPLVIIGGCTGGNKTGLIHRLQKMNERVVDLEGIAGHMGSAFGNLEFLPQPSQEHFENLLAHTLYQLGYESESPVWVEGESQRIGTVNIPLPFFMLMRRSDLVFMDIPFEKRLKHIIENYGHYEKESIISAILRIKKRLGGLETKNAISALQEDNISGCFEILLKYYDRLYMKSTFDKELAERKISYIKSDDTETGVNIEKILNYVKERQY